MSHPVVACRAAILCGLALALTGCQSLNKARSTAYNSLRSLMTSSYHDPHAEEKFAAAEAQFEAREFKAAQAVFSDLAENTLNPTLLAEKARYMEAECLRERNNLPDAAATYHRLLQDFPYGAYRERACTQMYTIAHGWLETVTFPEIEAEQAGQGVPWWQNPPLPNLTDNTRPLLDTEGEALKVLDNVQTNDPVGPHADKALFWLGYVHFYRGRYGDADYYLSQIVEFHKDSKLRPVALDMAIVAKNNATGGPVYDSSKASEALQLIHHAEASIPGYASDPEKVAEMTRRKTEVRFQLAQKYIEQAKYYERSGHPASAYFYYDLVVRQHPGTRSAVYAQERLAVLEPLKEQATRDRANGGPPPDVFGRIANGWDSLWGSSTAGGPRPPAPLPPMANPMGNLP